MHVRRALALALVVPLLLAGCSEDEPEPQMPDPPASSEPSPSPSEAETPEAESPEEFIRRWAQVLREAQVTGDTGALRQLGPDCESCLDTADRVDQIYKAGGVIEWGGWKILSIGPIGDSNREFRVVEKSAPTRYRESSGAPWQLLSGGRSPHVFELERAGTSWLVIRTAELSQ